MNWLAGVIQALAALAQAFLGYFRDRQLVEAGKVAERADAQAEVIHDVQVATDARNGVVADHLRDPGSLRVDDGFRRPE